MMKPALMLTAAFLILALLDDNHVSYYYGQMLSRPHLVLSMAVDALIIVSLFLGAYKLSIWLK